MGSLMRQISAIHHKTTSVDKVASITQKPYHPFGDLLWEPKALHGCPVIDLDKCIRAHLPRSIGQRGLDVTRDDCIALDLRVIKSSSSSYACNPMFCCSIST